MLETKGMYQEIIAPWKKLVATVLSDLVTIHIKNVTLIIQNSVEVFKKSFQDS
jgi:hypothetical protein